MTHLISKIIDTLNILRFFFCKHYQVCPAVQGLGALHLSVRYLPLIYLLYFVLYSLDNAMSSQTYIVCIANNTMLQSSTYRTDKTI